MHRCASAPGETFILTLRPIDNGIPSIIRYRRLLKFLRRASLWDQKLNDVLKLDFIVTDITPVTTGKASEAGNVPQRAGEARQ